MTTNTTPFTNSFAAIKAAAQTVTETANQARADFKARTVLLEGRTANFGQSPMKMREGVFPATRKDGTEHPHAGKSFLEISRKLRFTKGIGEVPEQASALARIATLGMQDMVIKATFIADQNGELDKASSRCNMGLLTGELHADCRIRAYCSFNTLAVPTEDTNEDGSYNPARQQWFNATAPEDLPAGWHPVRLTAELRIRSLYQVPKDQAEAATQAAQDEQFEAIEPATTKRPQDISIQELFSDDPSTGF